MENNKEVVLNKAQNQRIVHFLKDDKYNTVVFYQGINFVDKEHLDLCMTNKTFMEWVDEDILVLNPKRVRNSPAKYEAHTESMPVSKPTNKKDIQDTPKVESEEETDSLPASRTKQSRRGRPKSS